MAPRRLGWWIAGSILITTGAMWLAEVVWTTSRLGGRPYAPTAVGALVAGFTIATVVERRAVALALAGAVGSVALSYGAVHVSDLHPLWGLARDPGWSYYAAIAAASILPALAGTRLRRRYRQGGRLRWLWISALVTLGGIGTAVLALLHADSAGNGRALVLASFGATVVGCGLCQVLAPYRMIWTCGGGALIFLLFAADATWRTGVGSAALAGVFAAAFLTLIFILLGALGARIAWWLFRRDDPRTRPEPTELPPAQTCS
jgi:hypothetical protein